VVPTRNGRAKVVIPSQGARPTANQREIAYANLPGGVVCRPVVSVNDPANLILYRYVDSEYAEPIQIRDLDTGELCRPPPFMDTFKGQHIHATPFHLLMTYPAGLILQDFTPVQDDISRLPLQP
jgi:hypothetical protein